MTEPVPRTVSTLEEGSEGHLPAPCTPLAAYRDCPAYVLLGSPGIGKTAVFRREAQAHPNGAHVSARDFINTDNPEWPDKLLFIDGLDEMRAGAQDGRTPIDQIRSKLQNLGCSRFRLSCRTIDWWWIHDRQKMQQLGIEVRLLMLDPLTDDCLPEVLRQHDSPKNRSPEEFISQAQAHGLGEWLKNPQTLLLLADSIDEQGGWPHHHREIYEKACETLLSEPNEEHIKSGARQAPMDTLLEAAGRICAVQLLSGGAGYTLPSGKPNRDYPALESVVPMDIGKQVARTRVFDKIPGLERVVPEHQCTAEFLGGRYLAEKVAEGFSVNRILALMSSADGVVVPKFQGVAAWLAAYSRPARKELIKRVPLELALYGDVESFDPEDQRLLFDTLKEKANDNPRCIDRVRKNTPLRGLASPHLHAYLKEALSSPVTRPGEQSFRYLVLKALHGSAPVPGVSGSLLEIIRDEKSWPAHKELALEVFIQSRTDAPGTEGPLKELLSEIRAGTIRDFCGRLLETVLTELFPQHVSADEALDCLMDSRQPPATGLHTTWPKRLVEQLGPRQQADILNRLATRVDEVRNPKRTQTSFRLFGTFLDLFEETLSSTRDEEIDLDDLRHWLEAASCSKIRHTLPGAFRHTAAVIRDWLENRPDAHRVIFESGVRAWRDTDDFKLRAHETGNWLFQLPPAPDFWPRCLDLAVGEKHPETARFFLKQVAHALLQETPDIPLSLDDLHARVAGHPELEQAFGDMLVSELSEDYFTEVETRLRRIAMDLHEREQARQDWAGETRAQEKDLRQNRGSPELLQDLSIAYFGGFYDVEGEQPLARIRNLLDHDHRLAQVVLAAFEGALAREDAPSVGEIIRHAEQGRPHPLTYPCLAGLEETGDPPSTDPEIRRALAFHYFADSMLPGEVQAPAWYEALLANQPELVAEILIKRIRFQMRRGEEFLTESHELAFSKTHAKVARLAALPLLKSFPICCTARQLHGLGLLLAAALLHCKRMELRQLLKEKLAASKTKNMNMGQRIYWLAARFLISPKTHLQPLEAYLSGDEPRMRYFAGFVGQANALPEWKSLLEGCREPLIRLLGSSFRPLSLDEGQAWSSPPMAASDLIRGLIDHLAETPTADATDILGRLVADESLSPWKTDLQSAADQQHSLRRQSEFQHCSVSTLLQTLDKKKPAHVDDLVVLLLECFGEMGEKIRHGSTNDWHQYWNQPPRRSPELWRPKHEPDCRDAFLSDMQEKLEPLEIHAHREGSCADDTRADIQVFYKNLNLPIEVKKSHSGDLWAGIQKQLIPKYTRDPGAGGRGIYLVFWFGADSDTNPGTGVRPTSPNELQHQLEDSLAPEEADRVSIHVVDVARP